MNQYQLVLASESEALSPEPFADATIFQTAAWLAFLRETQHGEVIHARVLDEHGVDVGRFVGMVVRRMGLRILGSPFPGWTTWYMGFNLRQGASRASALAALPRFAFRTLRCAEIEVMDRWLTESEHQQAGFHTELSTGFEIDLTHDEDGLQAAMSSNCRWSIRRAARDGVVVEVANPDSFTKDYYPQLQDVFAKQHLTPSYGRSRVDALIRNLHPEGTLLLARALDHAGTPIATGIFPAWNGRMHFWGGASWREHQRSQPNEALIWFAMKYWKERGMHTFDMGGGGEYKRKFGGIRIAIPWGRRSFTPALESLREVAQNVVKLRQRASGRFLK